MFRFLPVLMVAFGLFLAITSFASAASPELADAQDGAVCVEATSGPAVATLDPPRQLKLVRCWRTVGMGIPVPSCQIEKGVTRTSERGVPSTGTRWPLVMRLAGHDGPAPLADVPPPKA